MTQSEPADASRLECTRKCRGHVALQHIRTTGAFGGSFQRNARILAGRLDRGDCGELPVEGGQRAQQEALGTTSYRRLSTLNIRLEKGR